MSSVKWLDMIDLNDSNLTWSTHHKPLMRSTALGLRNSKEEQIYARHIPREGPAFAPKLDQVNLTQHELFRNNVVSIVQIPLLVLIFILATSYIVMTFIQQNTRNSKLIWPTINVCLATILFVVNQLAFTVIRLHNSTSTVFSCRFQGFIVVLGGCHMMYSHSVSAVNRLLSVRYFFKLVFRSQHWLLGSMIAGWIVGSFVAFPYLFYDGFTCSASTRAEWLTPYSCLATFVLPVGIVGVCNVSIFWYLRQSHRRVHQLGENRVANIPVHKKDLHLSKVMLFTFVIFVIGWVPIYLEQLFIDDQRHLSTGISLLFQISLPLCLLVDMILLIHSNQPIRRLIQERCKCNRLFPCINRS